MTERRRSSSPIQRHASLPPSDSRNHAHRRTLALGPRLSPACSGDDVDLGATSSTAAVLFARTSIPLVTPYDHDHSRGHSQTTSPLLCESVKEEVKRRHCRRRRSVSPHPHRSSRALCSLAGHADSHRQGEPRTLFYIRKTFPLPLSHTAPRLL